MTLILGAVTKDAIVVGADGYEFQEETGKLKTVKLIDRKKLVPLPGRGVVLAVHGQNRIAFKEESLQSQRLVIDILSNAQDEFASIEAVKDIARKILSLLDDHVTHTFGLLQASNNHESELRIFVFGFDRSGGRSQCWEVIWPLLGNGIGTIERIVKKKDDVRVVHGGTGGRYAKALTDTVGSQYHPDKLKKATTAAVQVYVRSVYRKAESRQSKLPEFGGQYHEVTITTAGSTWTTPLEATLKKDEQIPN